MKPRLLFPIFLLAALVACQPASISPEGYPPPALATIQPAPIETLPPAYPAPAEPGLPPSSNLPVAVQNAIQALADQLQISTDQVILIEYQTVTWPDGCLGIEIPGMACTAALVPGYRVILEANGQQYEVRSNMSGSQVAVAGAPQPVLQPQEPASLTWKSNGTEECLQAEIGMAGITTAPCEGEPLPGSFASNERQDQLASFLQLYAPFSAVTPAGEIEFRSAGQVTATPAEQRMLAEWANITAQEAQAGRSGASWGLAIDVQGQITADAAPETCQHVTIYRTGQALAGGCQAEPAQAPGTLQLTGAQLSRLYRWVDVFQSSESSSATAADPQAGWTLLLEGQGASPLQENDLAEIRALADEIYLRLATRQDAEQIELSFQALQTYLGAVSNGDYKKAASLYGGDYEGIQSMNPDISSSDRAGLLESYCTTNGGVCNLGILNTVHKNQLDPQRVRFTVELRQPDGSLFKYGPCCGEDPAVSPPLTQFDFTVVQTADGFQVLELPPYVP